MCAVLLTAIQSSIIMLPVSILMAMVFRNVKPKQKEQRMIKDLMVFDEDETYADLVDMYERRKYAIDTTTYKSLSNASLDDENEAEEKPAENPDKASMSSSSVSSADTNAPHTEDQFVTPKEATPSLASLAGSRPEEGTDRRTEFSTAILTDIDTYTGLLPNWISYVMWGFAFVISVASGFFIILYTFSFGYKDSMVWCIAVLSSFFFGLFLEQPIKILLAAFALAFICRKATDIYPSELDIVADHSVRGVLPHWFIFLSVCLISYHWHCNKRATEGSCPLTVL